MYCPQCGTENADDAAFCRICGANLDAYRDKWGKTGVNDSQTEDTAAPAAPAPAAPPETDQAGTPDAPGTASPSAPSYIQPAGGPPPYQPVYPPPYQPQYQAPYQPHYQPGYQAPGGQAPGYQAGYQQPRTYPPYQAGYDPARGYYAPPHIPNYLPWAIVTMLLCFLPTGIVAVVFASKVDNRLAIGDIPGAREASHNAKVWCWVSFGVGVAIWVFWILIVVLIITAAVSTSGGGTF